MTPLRSLLLQAARRMLSGNVNEQPRCNICHAEPMNVNVELCTNNMKMFGRWNFLPGELAIVIIVFHLIVTLLQYTICYYSVDSRCRTRYH